MSVRILVSETLDRAQRWEQYSCRTCERIFVTSEALDAHVDRQHRPPQRPLYDLGTEIRVDFKFKVPCVGVAYDQDDAYCVLLDPRQTFVVSTVRRRFLSPGEVSDTVLEDFFRPASWLRWGRIDREEREALASIREQVRRRADNYREARRKLWKR